MTLLQGDCVSVMCKMPDACIDLTVTSPPYDDLRTYNGYTFDWKSTIAELYRITKDGGVVVWVVADQTKDGSETGTSFKQALWAKECGFNLHDTMVWNKGTCAFPNKSRYQNVFEYMFVFSKGRPKTTNIICDKANKYAGCKVHGTERQENGKTKVLSNKQESKNVRDFGPRSNVWSVTPEKHNKTGHPAVFPLALAKDHILTWSNEGDTVLDCFMGSGTTGIACEDTGRDFIGIELDPHYFEVAKQRIENTDVQLRMEG